MWLLTLLAISIPLAVLFLGRIDIYGDYFFFLLYAQLIIYLHLAPTLWASEINDFKVRGLYVLLQFGCIFLFELPFLWIYLRVKRRLMANPVASHSAWIFNARDCLRLAALAFILAVAFFGIAESRGILFTRLGEKEKLLSFLSLGPGQFAAYRMFQLTGSFLVCVLAAARLKSKTCTHRSLTWLLTLCVAGIYFLQAIINSREESLVFLALLLGTILYLGKTQSLSRRALWLGLIGALGGMYVLRTSEGFRQAYAEEGRIEWRLLNPFISRSGPEDTDLRLRLNGIDLMAEIMPAAEREGFAKGDAWKGMAVVALFQYFGSKAAVEYKESYLASPKAYLIQRYTNLGTVDYFSCILTDAYGNFGLLGFPMVALVLAWCCAYSTVAIARPSTPATLVLGLFLAAHMLSFDQQFSELLLGWVKKTPVLMAVLVVNPWKTIQSVRGLDK